jgi:hypothetical protein
MKHLLALPLALCILAGTVGCTGKVDQTALLAGANRGLSLAENTAVDLRQAGYISDSDWPHVQQISSLLQGYLDTWQSNLGKSAGDVAMQAFFSNLPQLLGVINTYNPAKKQAATRPVTHAHNFTDYGSYLIRAYQRTGDRRRDSVPLESSPEGVWKRAG